MNTNSPIIQFSRAVIRNEPHFQLLDDHFHNLGYEMGRNYRPFFITLLKFFFRKGTLSSKYFAFLGYSKFPKLAGAKISLREHSLGKI